jgi:hypothetical protein
MPIVLTPEERKKFEAFEPKDKHYSARIEQLYAANYDSTLAAAPGNMY